MDGTGRNGAVAVVGLGYVGLPTALGLLAAGRTVVGLDIDPERLDDVRRARVDLLPEDHRRLTAHLGRPEFELTSDADRLASAEAVLICVPTPVDAHRVPDLRALRGACADVVARARPGQTIVLTSTSYVGTTRDLLVAPLAARGLQVAHDVFVASAPERVDPGVPDHSQGACPRVVGGATPECGRRAAEVLAPLCGGVHMVRSPEAAELAKLLENGFRAVNIALANEYADIARRFGLDPLEVVEAAGTKPYGFLPFHPGAGAGGHCIPCDPHYLLWQLRAARAEAPVIGTAMAALAARPGLVARRAREVLGDHGVAPRGARVLLVGVAYKPDVADTRESPALTVIEELTEAGAEVAYTDPRVPRLRVGGIRLRHTPAPWEAEWDLAVVTVAHTGQDLSWLDGRVPVLDATYRLHEIKERRLP